MPELLTPPTGIVTPPEPSVLLPWFYPDADTERERERILRGRYFLVKTQGLGLPWKCSPKKGGCGGVHPYLTLRCVPRPFSGLTRGLFALWQSVANYGQEHHLSPANQSRFRDLGRIFDPVKGLPDLASAHPETARSLGAHPGDVDMGGYSFVAMDASNAALGVVEVLTPSEAQRWGRKINLRGIRPAFTLEGVDLR